MNNMASVRTGSFRESFVLIKLLFVKTFISSRPLLSYAFLIFLLTVSWENYGQGVLYGMTQFGGIYDKGVPYQINTDGTNFFSFRDFDDIEGGHPGDGSRFSQLTETPRMKALGLSANGVFAGLTSSGYRSLGYGNRVQIRAGNSGLEAPSGFTISQSITGTNPTGGLLAMSNGTLYGLMSENGKYGGGTLFSVGDFFVNGITVLASFDGINLGRSPKGSLIQGSNGRFYGTTEFGGTHDLGVIFSFDAISQLKTITKLVDFDGTAKGSNPTGNLLLASNGRLYGMTKNGGVYGDGVIFSISLDGTGYTKLLDLNGQVTGSNPKGSLTQFTDGYIYGMTSSGGAYGFGTIFRISPGGAFSKILDFDGINGKAPVGDLLVDVSGNIMYGVTYTGGSNDQGVLFKLQNTQFSKLYDFDASTGRNPVGSLSMIRKQPSLSVQPIPAKTATSAPFAPMVITDVDLPVYFASSDTSVIEVKNDILFCKAPGYSNITIFQLGNHAYLPTEVTIRVDVGKASQTIKFDPLAPKTFGDAPSDLNATSSSGLPVTFTSSNQSVATISGNTITIKGGGHTSIFARQSGNEKFESAAPIEQHLFVERAVQTITFDPISVRLCCNSFTLSATSTSGLPAIFESGDLTKITVTGTTAQPNNVGNVEIIAYHPGNANYKPAEKRASMEIRKGSQYTQLFFNNVPHKVGDAPVQAGYATSSAGLPVTFTSSPPGIAVVEKGYLYFLAAGTTTITATQTGNDKYYPAPSQSISVTIDAPSTPAQDNTISFPDLIERTVVEAPFNLTATATSGLPVSYASSNLSVAEVNGNLVTIKGVGTTTIMAFQPGDSKVAAAAAVAKDLVVKKKSQSGLMSGGASTVTYGVRPIPLQPTSFEGLPITYTLSDYALGSIENNYLKIKGVGTLTITASQAGDDLYLPAQTVSAKLTINPASDNVYFKTVPKLTYGDSPIVMEAWTASGLPVTFSSSDSDVASVNGSVLTTKAAGAVKLFASSVNPGYKLAQVQQNVNIGKKSQSITFSPVGARKFGDTSFQAIATSTSGLPVSFTSGTPGVVATNGQQVTIVGNGVAEIIASQEGDNNFEAAENIHQTFLVSDAGKTYELIGTTVDGGPNHSGVVFSMNSEGTVFEYLKQFAMRTSPNPQAGFIKGLDGKFYANFATGGSGDAGSIVRVEADGTGLTYIHHLQASEGQKPTGNLIQSSDGYLYGTTQSGGKNDGGTIFRLKPDGTEFAAIYHFSALSGRSPRGGVTEADNGKLYGITPGGGFYGYGTIFSVNTDGSGFSILLQLRNQAPINSGISPSGELVQGADGFLYGTTRFGGNSNYGTLFKIRTDGSAFTNIVHFGSAVAGSVPSSAVLIGSDGKLYGMTAGGGALVQGTIFSVNPDGTQYVQLYSFGGTGAESSLLGSNPFGKLAEGSDGFLYGLVGHGGSNGKGFIFKISKDGNAFQTLVNLDDRASYPASGPLTESSPGTFLGMTSMGGSLNGGAIIQIFSAGEFRVLQDFLQEQSSPRNLIPDAAGEYYYGIAGGASSTEGGSIFRISKLGLAYEQLYKAPVGDIIKSIFYASTGHLWVSGIRNEDGFLFRIKPDGSNQEDIMPYNTAFAQKRASVKTMVESSDGELFAATDGSTGSVFFKIMNDGTGFAKLYDLAGGRVTGNLLLGSDGNLYTAYDYKGVFMLTSEGVMSNIFQHPNQNDSPEVTRIIEMNGGRLGITTKLHGSGGVASSHYSGVFSIEKDGTDYLNIFQFASKETGSVIDMVQSMDGWLYVVSEYGGTPAKGLIYKVRPDGSSFTKIKEFNGGDGENPTVFSSASHHSPSRLLLCLKRSRWTLLSCL